MTSLDWSFLIVMTIYYYYIQGVGATYMIRVEGYVNVQTQFHMFECMSRLMPYVRRSSTFEPEHRPASMSVHRPVVHSRAMHRGDNRLIIPSLASAGFAVAAVEVKVEVVVAVEVERLRSASAPYSCGCRPHPGLAQREQLPGT